MQRSGNCLRYPSPEPDEWGSRYSMALYHYAFSRVNNKEQAKELVQETFLAGLQGLHAYHRCSSEKTWLTAILKNKIFRVYRTKRIEKTNLSKAKGDSLFIDTANEEAASLQQTHSTLIAEYALQDTYYDLLIDALDALPPLWRSVMNMKYFGEMQSDQICAALKLSPGNYWVISHRARARIKKYLLMNLPNSPKPQLHS